MEQEQKKSGYKLQKAWFTFVREHPGQTTPAAAALYFYCLELCNSLGWPETFGLPSEVAMASTAISSYNTYKRALNCLFKIGAVKLIAMGRNQHTAKIVALSNFDIAETDIAEFNEATAGQTPSALSKFDKATAIYKNNKRNKPINNMQQAGAPVPIEDIEGENSPVPGLKPSGGIITPSEPIKPVAGKFAENNSSVPSLQEVIAYAKQIGRDEATARDFHEVSSARNWKDSKGQPISSWRNLLAKWQQPAPKQAKAPEIPRPANADDWPDDFPELQDPAQSPETTAAREQEARELLNRLGGLNRKAGNQPPASGHGADFDTL